MNIHDMTEQAYKNGYEAGKKETQAEIERLKAECKITQDYILRNDLQYDLLAYRERIGG